MSNPALTIGLQAAVPLHIMELQSKGGPSDADYAAARAFSTTLGEKGDVLQYGSTVKGEVTDLFNQLAKCIAILAFCPGGISMFGEHWES